MGSGSSPREKDAGAAASSSRVKYSRDGKSPTALKYARERLVDGKLGKFTKPYAKLLEFDFSSFVKKTKDSKWFWQTLGDAH